MGSTVRTEFPRFRTQRVMRCGGSCAVTIPRAYCEHVRLTHLDEVKVYVVGDVLCIQPARGEMFTPHVISVALRSPEESGVRSQESE